MARVVLAMSGGVDSSVAAHLLTESGHQVIGVFMRHGSTKPAACTAASPDNTGERQAENDLMPLLNGPLAHKQGCCSAADAEDARRVADQMEIPFYALNLQAEFSNIIDYFVDEYTAGRTPNPCVMCNNWIKFGRLFDYADSVNADYVATGHYARLETATGNPPAPRLLRGQDADKDQSYVLFGIARKYLSRMLLPVGRFHKAEIRDLARSIGLRVAEKKDSQEICFVPPGQHAKFVRQQRPETNLSGDIVTTSGDVVGQHSGIEGFTIGQRKGLGVAFGEPRFVVRIEPDTRRIIIGEKSDLARDELTARQTNWLSVDPVDPFRCCAQIRYNGSAQPATAYPLPENQVRIVFDEPTSGVAPGQAVVCYTDNQVLGGGWIQ
ncbi:MAG: tRNA 2-thiouridine(34) synthase MnmA [Planctomycetaceae bacterium]|nr:tRNA 2-thiouridine(34) synthase MnmA [Planctomycetaceae bacterium]